MTTRIFISTLLLLPMLASEKTVGGIAIPGQRENLNLQGAGLLRKGFFFKVYVGALYVERGTDIDNIVQNAPKRLDIHYFRHTPKNHMIHVATATLQKNLSEKEYRKFLPKLEQLHQAYFDGMKNSYASIEYRPGKGLYYSVNEKLVINIPDEEFAKAYFTVWLGEKPSSESMKQALLGLSGKTE